MHIALLGGVALYSSFAEDPSSLVPVTNYVTQQSTVCVNLKKDIIDSKHTLLYMNYQVYVTVLSIEECSNGLCH
jgi:hypothetical protein